MRWKYTLNAIDGRIEIIEGKTNELEYRAIETTQNKIQREKIVKKKKQNQEYHWTIR